MTTYEYTLPITAADIMVFNISGNYTSQAPPARVFACDVGEFLSVALERLTGKRLEPRPGWEEALSQARVMWDGLCQIALSREGDLPAGARVARTLDELLPHDTIVSVGAGTHLLYAMDFMPSRNPLTFMSTVNFGSMGFGFAANLASRLVFPDRSAIAMLGDGDFMMTIQDLETAVREDIPVKVFVMNDSQYRVLNIRQKLQFGGRIHGTEHGNPDFAALARDFGAAGYRLDRDSDTRDVLEKALAEKGSTVIDVIIDQDDLPPLNIEANLRMSM
jgi:acetolactate synthase-1/2/3 large subunit